MIATIKDGKLEIIEWVVKRKVLASFEPMDVEGLAKFFMKNSIHQISCSSSCDFPKEYGMPGVDVRQWMQEAWKSIFREG